MLHWLPAPLRGGISFSLLVVNSLWWCALLLAAAVAKLIVPLDGWRRRCDPVLNAVASGWVACNNLNFRLVNRIRWNVVGLEGLEAGSWYLVVANHQSWADIFILQKIFHRRIPFLKFFLKQELIWVPLLGLAWWALDYPFMKRYPRSVLERHPELRGQDLAAARRACLKFETVPVSIMNFAEGTRYTPAKGLRRNTPFEHLLRPKAGGAACVLGAMGGRIHRILDVTIAYPRKQRSFWNFLCGRVDEVRVWVDALPVSSDLMGDYSDDDEYRRRMQQWIDGLWRQKDRRIAAMTTDGRKWPAETRSARTARPPHFSAPGPG